jgi:hypothetical protein
MLLTVPVRPQSAPPSNDECQACHSDLDMKRSDGRLVRVLPAHFRRPVHGQFACVDYHRTPHRMLPSDGPDSPTHKFHVAASRGRCHGGATTATTMRGPAAGAFADSIHDRALAHAGLGVAPTCCEWESSQRRSTKTSGRSKSRGSQRRDNSNGGAASRRIRVSCAGHGSSVGLRSSSD